MFNADLPQERIGDMRPHDARYIGFQVRLPDSDKKDLEYAIVFRARNGSWTEFSSVRRAGSRIKIATKIYSGQKLIKNVPF